MSFGHFDYWTIRHFDFGAFLLFSFIFFTNCVLYHFHDVMHIIIRNAWTGRQAETNLEQQ